MRLLLFTLTAIVAFVSGDRPSAQDSKPASLPAAASPADVASVDAILKSLYDVISGPPGQSRNWQRFRSLFIPKAQLIVASPRPDGGTQPIVMSIDDYVKRADSHMRENGFFEREISRFMDSYADIAQVFSTYESRRAATDEKPFARGINSIQLMKDKDRWWVVTIFWCQETAAHPLPDQYLPPK